MNTTTTHRNPTWWDNDQDSAWGRVKDAFKRDWDQTKHDFGGNEPDTNQNVSDTVKQAAGKETIPPRHTPTFEDLEPAYRYGYAAHNRYGDDYAEWDDQLEARLREEWTGLDPARKEFWPEDRDAIRYGWEFDER